MICFENRNKICFEWREEVFAGKKWDRSFKHNYNSTLVSVVQKASTIQYLDIQNTDI